MIDDATTDRILRFPDGERVGRRLTPLYYRQGDGAGHVLLIILAFLGLFAFAFLMAGCDEGAHGNPCYGNHTCKDGMVCVWWTVDDETQSRCVRYDALYIGGYKLPTCDVDGGVVTRRTWR